WVYPKHSPEEEETRQKTILEHRAWIRRMIQLNYSLASDRLQQMLREDEYCIQKEIERPEKERQIRIKRLESIQDIWKDPEAFAKANKRDGYFYDATTIPTPTIRYNDGEKIVTMY